MVHERTTAVEGFDSRVAATALAASQTRDAFEVWMHTTQADENTMHELSIVFSEVMANAVRASPTVHHRIEASSWVEDGKIVLRIANLIVASSAPVTGPDLDDPLRTGGRGLLIVRAYTDTVRTELVGDTIAIRCERRISS